MNKTVINFTKAHPITSIWIETGNPRQPLARVWIGTNGNPLATNEVEGLRLCA